MFEKTKALVGGANQTPLKYVGPVFSYAHDHLWYYWCRYLVFDSRYCHSATIGKLNLSAKISVKMSSYYNLLRYLIFYYII